VRCERESTRTVCERARVVVRARVPKVGHQVETIGSSGYTLADSPPVGQTIRQPLR
jgi:hypothetical protein